MYDITAPRAGAAGEVRAASAPGVLVRLYGVIAYALFLATIAWFWLFVGGYLVPVTLDRGHSPLAPALAVDLALVALFGLQHSVMARASFKRRLARILPASMERSTFVLVSGLMLVLLFWIWQPIPAIVWRVEGAPAGLLRAGFWVGAALAVASTFAISHAELFGLMQSRVMPGGGESAGLRLPPLYRIVRHPMHLGMLATLWATPRMTAGHLLFALAMTAYMLIGIRFEERDLLKRFGVEYRAYRRRTPALLFFLRPSWPRAIRAGALLALLALASAGAARARPLAPSLESRYEAPMARDSVVVEGRVRTFDYFVPAGLASGAPMVVALHGTGGSGQRFRHFLGGELERLAARHGFAVAYPQAFGGAWNSCRKVRSAATRAGVDDVAMVRAVSDHVARRIGTHRGRVFAVGYSGGGHLAYRLALEAPDAVSGVLAIGANLPIDEHSICRPAGDAVPLMIVNGTEDLINPYGGGPATGPSGSPLGRVRSAEETAEFFGALADARAQPPEAVVTQGDGPPAVQRALWDGPGSDVALYTVRGAGHTIPGPRARQPALLGPTERRWNAVEEAMRFFGLARAP